MKQRHNKNLRTIGAAFAALAMLSGAQQAKAIPVDSQQEVKKQVYVNQDQRKKVKGKREIEPGGPTRDGIFFPGFTSPIFSPTRSERIKNKRTGHKKYFINGKKRR
jgi:hypothetical protein